MDLFWKRDESAIHMMAEKYGAVCRRIAANILGNSGDAEECINDMYLHVWNAIPPQRPKHFAAYLGKLVRNLALNVLRRDRADKRGGGQIPLVLEELGEIVSGGTDPEDEYAKQEVAAAINAFLADLSEEKRTIFVRRYWYADSVKRIAADTGRSENYVSVALNRLRKQLYAVLTEKGCCL